MGEGPGQGYNVNVPLPAETYDDAFLLALDRVVLPLLGAYQPGVLMLELGPGLGDAGRLGWLFHPKRLTRRAVGG